MTYVLIDIIIVNLSYILALAFRFNFKISYSDLLIYENNVAVISLTYILSFYMFKLYENLWDYASVDEFMFVVGACIFGDLCSVGLIALVGSRLPYTVSVLAGILLILLITGSRMSFRINKRLALWFNKSDNDKFKKVMIIGAGRAGCLLIKEMKLHHEMNYKPIVLIDDDKSKLQTENSTRCISNY